MILKFVNRIAAISCVGLLSCHLAFAVQATGQASTAANATTNSQSSGSVQPSAATTTPAANSTATPGVGVLNQSASGSPLITPPAPDVNANGFVLMDATTGQIIASKNMYERMPPASLTKLMTMYIISKSLADGKIHLTDQVPISKEAWQTGGSRMFIQPNTSVSVDDLIQGIVVVSGNDATVAMAEYLGGSESSFVPLMNAQAKALGMNNTNYTDANGLPAPDHYSCPHDIALLARHIIVDFPQYYHFYGEKYFTYNNIKQPNRNRLLWWDPSVDGLKTGHTEQAGYCLVASAKRGDMRLISVVMGAPTDHDRAADNQQLLNYGFRFFKTTTVYNANQTVTQAPSYFGQNKMVSLGLSQDLVLTLPVGQAENLKANLTLPKIISAPISKGQRLGTMTLMLNNQVIATRPLVAVQANPEAGLFSRLADHISLMFQNLFHKNPG